VGEAEPEVFDRTFLVEKEDAPAAKGDPWPVPQPWQGLPRLAYVINLNYVYDEESEEWVRQGPFSGGGGLTVVASGTFSLPGNTETEIPIGLSDADLGGDVLIPGVALTADPGTTTRAFQFTADQDSNAEIAFGLEYEVSDGEWKIDFANNKGATAEIAFKVLRV